MNALDQNGCPTQLLDERGKFTLIYDPENIDPRRVAAMASKGLGIPQIAARLGMSKTTFEKAMRKIPDLRVAVDIGNEIANSDIVNVAYEMAASGEDPRMTQYWLNCRAKWTAEPVEVNVNHKHQLVPLTKDSIQKAINEDPFVDVEYEVKDE